MINIIINSKIKMLAQKERTVCFKNMDAIKTVLLLFETSEYAGVESVVTELCKLGKQVVSCGYVVKNDTTSYVHKPTQLFIYPKQHTNWLKEPSQSIINELIAYDYDIIIDLTLQRNPTLEYLLLFISSPFRVGLNKNNKHAFDFSISVDRNFTQGGEENDSTKESLEKDKESITDNIQMVEYIGKQIIHYLQTIHHA